MGLKGEDSDSSMLRVRHQAMTYTSLMENHLSDNSLEMKSKNCR